MQTKSYKKLYYYLLCFFYRIVTMEFYGKNDLTLGVFLERYCFRWCIIIYLDIKIYLISFLFSRKMCINSRVNSLHIYIFGISVISQFLIVSDNTAFIYFLIGVILDHLTSAPACTVRPPWFTTSGALCMVKAVSRLYWKSWTRLYLDISTQSSTTHGAVSANR